MRGDALVAQLKASHLLSLFRASAAGIDAAALSAAITEMRGGKKVTSESAESTFDALTKYGEDLVARAEAGKIDPVIGACGSDSMPLT